MNGEEIQPEVKKLIDALEASAVKPDLRSLGIFIRDSLSPMRSDDWDRLSAALCTAYGFASEAELSQHIRTPLFTREDEYWDDFSPLLHTIGLSGWLSRYVEHTRNMEPPTAYHFATGLTVLGATLKRQVYVDQSYFKIWPAVQSILIGPAGKTKKSTAATYGIGLGEAAERVYRLADEGTIEGTKNELAELSKQGDAAALLFASELSVLLGKEKYNVGMVKGLTDLFDSRTSIRRRTKTHGNEILSNLAVSFLGCTNEEWLADLPESAFGGGFWSRVLVWYQCGTDRSFPRPKITDEKEYEFLRTELLRTRFIIGSAQFEKGANTYYESRYRELKKNWPEDEKLSPFWERYPDHLLRMSLIISISDSLQGGPLITERAMLQADEILKWVIRGLPSAYKHMGLTHFSQEQQRILSFLQRSGGILSEARLGRKMRMSQSQLEEHVTTLEKYKVLVRKPAAAEWDGRYECRLLRKSEEV